jgi:hypothetical protein
MPYHAPASEDFSSTPCRTTTPPFSAPPTTSQRCRSWSKMIKTYQRYMSWSKGTSQQFWKWRCPTVQDGILKELRFLTVLRSHLSGQLGLHHLGFLFYGLCDVSWVQHMSNMSTHLKHFKESMASLWQFMAVSCSLGFCESQGRSTQCTEPEQILLPRRSRCSTILENLHVPLVIHTHGLCVLYWLVLSCTTKHTKHTKPRAEQCKVPQ